MLPHSVQNQVQYINEQCKQGGRSCSVADCIACDEGRPALVSFGNKCIASMNHLLVEVPHVREACQAKSGKLKVLYSKRLGLPLPLLPDLT
jgi:hypothetical protein